MSAAQMRTEKAHFLRLDTLRGVAILLVFLFHYWLTIHQRDSHLANESILSPSLSPLLSLHKLGFLGVQLFFVISGFCIHYSFLSWKQRSADRPNYQFFRGFYHRRFWRIVPPYLVALLCFYFLKTPQPFSSQHLTDLLPHLALSNTLIASQEFQINPSFWSVAVEWQLYLAYPLVLWLFIKFGSFRAFLAASVVGAIFRFGLPMIHAPFWIENLPFRWWYEWTVGVLVAALWSERRRLFPQSLMIGFGLAALTYFAILYTNDMILKWMVPPFFFAYVVEACVWSTRPVSRLSRSMGLLGICSYSFYLWHQPLVGAAVSFFARKSTSSGPFEIWVGFSALIFVAITVIAAASYQLIEKPSIAIGHLSLRTYRARKIAQRLPEELPLNPAVAEQK